MSLARRFGVGLIWNYGGRIGEYGLRFLFISMVAKQLGPDEFGTFSFALSVFTIAHVIVALGYDQAINNYAPRMRDNKSELAYVVKRVVLLRLAILALVALGIAGLAPFLAQRIDIPPATIVLVIPYVVTFSLLNLFSYLLVGLFIIKQVAWMRVGIQILNLGFGFVAINMGWGVNGLLLIMTGSTMVFAITAIYVSREYWSAPAKPIALDRIHHFAVTLGVTNGLNYLLGRQSDIFLLAFLLGNTLLVGYYDLAATLTFTISTGIMLGLEGITHSAFAELANERSERVADAWTILLKFTVVTSVPLLLFLAVHADTVVSFYGEQYAPAVILLQLYLLFAVGGRLIGGGLNTTALYALGKERLPLAVRIFTGVLNLVLGVIFILRFGVIGAVIATGIAGMVHVIEAYLTTKHTGAHYPFGFVLKTLIASTVAVALSFPLVNTSLFSLGIGVAVCGIVFCVVLILMNPFSVEERTMMVKFVPPLALVPRIGKP